MDNTILLVVVEANTLNALARLFLNRDVRVLRAGNGEEALGIVRKEPVAVVVSDDLMPGTRGVELLSRVRDLSPDTVRVLLTETADLPAAAEAIARGEVSRFQVKPWVDEEIVRTVEEGLWRYRMVRSLRHGDEATLQSIAETIELRDPYTRGHCDRMAAFALKIAEALSLPEETRRAIRLGSWLHDCGKINVPETILNRPGRLSAADFEVVRKHPEWGAEVGRQANLPEEVINIILYHHERFDGRGYPTGAKGTEIPLEARLIAVADIF
ncbi:MAG: HD domain-containing protein, partial [Deltaproteobacteria bacterium]